MGRFDFSEKCTHDQFLSLGKGELWGLPGMVHKKRFKEFDLNLLLTEQFVPHRPFTSGIGVTLPPAPKGEKLIYYPIRDGRAPTADAYLKWILSDIELNLLGGKRVAISCFGGHGRTGTLLALVYSLFRDDDPIRAIRDGICNRCIESQEQMEFVFSYHDKTLLEEYVFIPKAPIDWGPLKNGKVVDWSSPLGDGSDTWWKNGQYIDFEKGGQSLATLDSNRGITSTGIVDPWTNPVYRIQDFEQKGFTFDFDADQLSDLPCGEVVGIADGKCFPVIRVEGKDYKTGALTKGAIIRYTCTTCWADMALSATVENALVCVGCSEEKLLPPEWKGYKFATLHISQ